MSFTTTSTTTRTVVDVRKTFESFAADLDMIAGRTRTWDTNRVDNMAHDVLRLAEASYLKKVDIVLRGEAGQTLRASSYVVNENGTLSSGDRAGANTWPYVAGAILQVVVEPSAKWLALGTTEQRDFLTGQRSNWAKSEVDTTYPTLRREGAQQYATNGYELIKTNYV